MIGAFATLAATLVSLAGATLTPAQAPSVDDLPLDLSWVAPESCPNVEIERAEIRRRVGIVDQTQLPALISAQVEIRASTSGSFMLSLRTKIGETSGERELSGPDCGQLADAVALVLALLINPDAAPDTSTPRVATPPVPVPAAPTSVLPIADFSETARFALGIEAVLAGGVLPGMAKGLAARMHFQHGPWVLGARAGGFFPEDQNAAILPGARASFYVLESALEICARTWPGRRLGAMICLGGAVERLHGESSGVSTPGHATAYWPEALAEISGQVRLTWRTRLRIAAEARGLGSRPDFAILGLGSVFRPAAASLRGSLGVDMLF